MVLVLCLVAGWLALAVVLGVTIGRAIRRADEVELGSARQVDAGEPPGHTAPATRSLRGTGSQCPHSASPVPPPAQYGPRVP